MMLKFAFATLRERKGSFAGAFIALVAAAALVCGCGMLFITGLLGTISPERYAGAPILVSGDQNVHQIEEVDEGKAKYEAEPIADRAWISADLADKIKAAPGVEKVVTEVTFPAYLPDGRTAESWGHGWESAALGGLTLADGRAPSAPGEVVLDAVTARDRHLAIGDATAVRTQDGTSTVRVVGVTQQGFASQSGLYFATDEARRLAAHPGLVSAIGVYPASAAAGVKSALTGTTAQIHTGDDRGRIEFLDASDAGVKLISMGAALGGTSLLVSLLVVVGTFGLSIQQRHREIALLRAVAATPRQVKKMIGGEALVVAVLAAGLGAVAGVPLGGWLLGRFVALDVVPANLPMVVSPFPALVAFTATLAAAWGAARVSARRAVKIRPVEALTEADLKPPRISWIRAVFGVLFVGGATTLTLLLTIFSTDAASSPVSQLAALLWCIALATLGPPIARVTMFVVGIPLRISRIGGFLAASNLRAASHRLASVVTPLTLLVTMACTILFTQATTSHAATAQVTQGTKATYVIGPKVPAGVAADLRKIPGVTATTEVLHTTVLTGLKDHHAQAVTPAGIDDTLDLKITEGSLAGLNATTMAAASGTGHHVGDDVALTLGDGTPVTLRVIAIYSRGLGFGDLTLDHDLVAAHVDVPLDDGVLVTAPGVAKSAIEAALRGDPGIGVTDPASLATAQEQTGKQIGYVFLGLIIAFTAIAVMNTLVMTISDRSREFAALRLIGATRRQVLRMLRWETLAVVLTATAFGTVFALAVLTTYATGMTGSSRPYISLTDYALVVGLGAVLAALATFLPARLALRAADQR